METDGKVSNVRKQEGCKSVVLIIDDVSRLFVERTLPTQCDRILLSGYCISDRDSVSEWLFVHFLIFDRDGIQKDRSSFFELLQVPLLGFIDCNQLSCNLREQVIVRSFLLHLDFCFGLADNKLYTFIDGLLFSNFRCQIFIGFPKINVLLVNSHATHRHWKRQ